MRNAKLLIVIVVALVACALGGVFARSWLPQRENPHVHDATATPSPRIVAGEALVELEREMAPQIERFCSYCHPAPNPADAPREEWRHELELAYGFHKASPLSQLTAPDFEKVVAYYEALSRPASQLVVPPRADAGPGPLTFTLDRHDFSTSRELAVAGLTFVPGEAGNTTELLACEMQTGRLRSIDADGEHDLALPRQSAGLTNPCRIERCDLDADGRLDYVVADLGNFLPTDDPVGRVVWLRRLAEKDAYETIVLAQGIGRVADVRPGDFDNDGDADLVVAEFGWQKLGQVFLLENRGADAAESGGLAFERRQLDDRHGAIHVPTTDLNGDGRLDFVALFAQEHEIIVAFINRGDGSFEKQKLYAAPHPLYGSSSIQLTDLDSDNDVDVLYANGDGFDRRHLKPYHSVQWLENQGEAGFVHRHLTYMPGGHRALAGDLDGDGDADVVCAAFLQTSIRNTYGPKKFDGVVWLEQTRPGTFVRHGLRNAACDHATLELGDFDNDGDLDFATGAFVVDGGGQRKLPASVEIWWNDRLPGSNKVGGRL